MSYIGNTATQQAFTPAVDYFNGNGSTTAFTLSRPVASVAQIQVVIENVPQNPSSAYTVSGNTITFTSAPPNGTNNIYVEYTSPITQVSTLTQSPSVVGDLTTSGGQYAQGTFASAFTDGIVQDYTSGTGRITVGASDGFKIRNGGPSSPVDLLALDSSGNGTLIGNLTLNNGAADGAQLTLNSLGYSSWNWDNYSGRLRAYYNTTEYFTIDTSGNVGIGTSSPVSLGAGWTTTDISSASAKAATIYLHGNGTSGASGGFQLQGGSDGLAYLWNFQNTAMAFATNNAERARIDSSGNLLVGTTTLYGKVTSEAPGANSTESPFSANVSSASGVGACFVLRSLRGGTLVGSITNTSTATAYNTSSDYRLKENVQPMTDALSVVQALKPVTYTWKSDGSDGQGFIAHELQAVVPDCVTGEKDAVDADGNPVYQGIDTSFLVATLTAAIQEQQALITQQAAALTTLTERIAALENK